MLNLGYYCVGAEEGIAAVKFDGTNDYLNRNGDLTGAADGTDYILSCWLKPLSDGNTEFIYHSYQSGSGLFLTRQSSNDIRFIAFDSSSSQVQSVRSSITNITIANGWRHLLISGKSATPGSLFCQMYIDDVDVSSVVDSGAGTIDFTKTQHTIGASAASGASIYNGCLSEIYVNFGESLDLSIESNRRKFIDASGNPADLGSDGSSPTGTQPVIYLKDSYTSFQTNYGYGGNFSVIGALEVCASSPSA